MFNQGTCNDLSIIKSFNKQGIIVWSIIKSLCPRVPTPTISFSVSCCVTCKICFEKSFFQKRNWKRKYIFFSLKIYWIVSHLLIGLSESEGWLARLLAARLLAGCVWLGWFWSPLLFRTNLGECIFLLKTGERCKPVSFWGNVLYGVWLVWRYCGGSCFTDYIKKCNNGDQISWENNKLAFQDNILAFQKRG